MTSNQRRILETLIQRQGLRPGGFALFFVTGEGSYLPVSSAWGKIEETSGYVLDRHGRIFTFWLGWDAARRRPTLTEWEEVAAEPGWETSREYQEALREVGLSAA